MTILKKIHQIWLGQNPVPVEFTSSWIKMCSQYGWEYKLWRDDDIDNFNLINRYNYDVEQTPQGKSDICRYEIINKYGGFYVDCDMIWLGNNLEYFLPLDSSDFIGVPEYPSVSIPDGTTIFIANGFFGSCVNHPILNKIIAELPNNYKKYSHMNAIYKTGPFFLNKHLISPITVVPTDWIFPVDFHYKTKTKDPSVFKDKSLVFTYNTQEYPHHNGKMVLFSTSSTIFQVFIFMIILILAIWILMFINSSL